MAEALGWTADVPAPTVTGGGGDSGGAEPFGRGGAYPDQPSQGPSSEGRVVMGFPRRDDTGTSEDGYRERDWRDQDEPAHSITEKARSAVKREIPERGPPRVYDRRQGTTKPNGERVMVPLRDENEPAPTIRYGERMNDVSWVEERPAPTIVTTRRSDQGIIVGRQLPEGEGRNVGGHGWVAEDSVDGVEELPHSDEEQAASVDGLPVSELGGLGEGDAEAVDRVGGNAGLSDHGPTVAPDGETSKSAGGEPDDDAESWTQRRPSTAVCGDPRIFEPGWRGAPSDYAEDGTFIGKRAGDNAVRVTIEEASILQGFPPDYPWQGSRTKQFQQIGNAVPPPLALAVLTELVGEQADELPEAA